MTALQRFINLSFRGVGSAAKLLVGLSIGFFLGEEDLGTYGLVSSMVVLGVFFVGFEFHNFSTREIVKRGQVTLVLGNQFVFQIAVFLLVSFSYYIWAPDSWKVPSFLVLCNLVLSELLAQEFYRVFIALRLSVQGSIAFGVRTFAWIFPMLFFLYSKRINDVDVFFSIWILCNYISAIFSGVYLFFIGKLCFSEVKLSLGYIQKGIRQSVPFFLATFLGVSQSHLSRFFLEYFSNRTDVGVYTFYSSFSMVANVLVHSLVIVEFLPLLLAKRDTNDFHGVVGRFKANLKKYSLVGSVFPMIIIPYLFIAEKVVLAENTVSFLLILSGFYLSNYSNYYHYLLYVHRLDRNILISAIVSFLVAVVLNYLLVPHFFVLGAAISFLISQIVKLILKRYYFYKIAFSL